MGGRAYEAGYEELEETFGARFRRGAPGASVIPESAEDVGLVAEIAQRHALPLSLRGAGTSPGPTIPAEGVSLSFDHMKRFSVRDGEEPSVELEPGIPWVELEDHLQEEGKSLRVYPTSAPRSTVGGWLARDGLGIGSYEYGWLSENVDSVEVVVPGGTRRVAKGEELTLIVGAEGVTGIIVGATLKLRERSRDLPFAAAFDTPADLARALESIADEHPPLWHLGLAHPTLPGGPEEGYVLYGTHAGEIGGRIEAALDRAVSGHRGKMLSPAEAYRSWGARFFPAGPAGDLPTPATATVQVLSLGEALLRLEDEAAHLAVQGTVARGGEVLLITFRIGEEGGVETPGEEDQEILLRIARQAGGGEYLVGLRRYENHPSRDALLRLKEEVDPKGILQAAR
jgi:glycolate oxidase